MKMIRLFMAITGFLLLANCATNSTSQASGSEPAPVIPEPEKKPQEPAKPQVVIGRTIKHRGHGYAIEVMPTLRGQESGTPGQEYVFVIAHPDLPTTYARANVMSVVFVSRFNATAETMVDQFLTRYPRTQIKTRKAIPGGYWIVAMDNKPGARNSLMFTRILFNAQTKQAISYSLNIQVAADVEAMRNSSNIDDVAEALLNLFYLEPLP